ncbi:MAG: tetraacyldisaccharide 4'-kinase [Alphaproteobacteria bacterium]|nr:tetraacyldisaccharide 4'-kinase [Alphaproteobacteria bacterium]
MTEDGDGTPQRAVPLYARLLARGYRVGLQRRLGRLQRQPAKHRFLFPAETSLAAKGLVRVVAVGNATVGGSGKTPVVLQLARDLSALGSDVAIVSRGYRPGHFGRMRAKEPAPRAVDPAHDVVEQVGDEPLMMAKQLDASIPVVVGSNRGAAVEQAIALIRDRRSPQEQDNRPLVVLSDDGLLNPGLCPTLRILVVGAKRGFGNNRLFPAGPLREPLAACAERCHAIVYTDPTSPKLPHAPIPQYTAIGKATLLQASESRQDAVLTQFCADHALAFAAIANPDRFFDAVTTMTHDGQPVARQWHRMIRFPDHHRYDASDIQHLRAEATAQVRSQEGGVRGGGDVAFFMTSKDRVKLSSAMLKELCAPITLDGHGHGHGVATVHAIEVRLDVAFAPALSPESDVLGVSSPCDSLAMAILATIPTA